MSQLDGSYTLNAALQLLLEVELGNSSLTGMRSSRPLDGPVEISTSRSRVFAGVPHYGGELLETASCGSSPLAE